MLHIVVKGRVFSFSTCLYSNKLIVMVGTTTSQLAVNWSEEIANNTLQVNRNHGQLNHPNHSGLYKLKNSKICMTSVGFYKLRERKKNQKQTLVPLICLKLMGCLIKSEYASACLRCTYLLIRLQLKCHCLSLFLCVCGWKNGNVIPLQSSI